MDNVEWAPAPGLVALAWVITAAAAVWTAATWLTSADPAGGLIAAATGMQSIPTMPYLQAIGMERDEFIPVSELAPE